MVQFNGNWLIFNEKNKNKPQVLRLIEIVEDRYAFVIDDKHPTEILKWDLEPSLIQVIPQFKRVLFKNNQYTLIKVTYKGKIKKEETFEIKQKAMDGYYPIEYDLSHISFQKGVYTVHPPKYLNANAIIIGNTVETAIRYRDFYRLQFYANLPKKPTRCTPGIAQRLEKYAKEHEQFDVSEIQEVMYSKEKPTVTRKLNTDAVKVIESKGFNINELVSRLASEMK